MKINGGDMVEYIRRFIKKSIGIDADVVIKTPCESALAFCCVLSGKGRHPVMTVLLFQCINSIGETRLLLRFGGPITEPVYLDLGPDKFGMSLICMIVMIVKPVGKYQPRCIILWMIKDILDKNLTGLFKLRHAYLPNTRLKIVSTCLVWYFMSNSFFSSAGFKCRVMALSALSSVRKSLPCSHTFMACFCTSL